MSDNGFRFFVIPPDGAIAVGYDSQQAAEQVAGEYGEGAHIVDTMAMPYHPMAQRIEGGKPVFLEYGGWDIRGSVDGNLMEAVKKGYVPLVHAFLAKGADVNATDAGGGTPLIWAVARGVADVVAFLVERGADVNCRDGQGLSPLGLARRKKRDEIAALLEKAGAQE